ncbi:MAG: response regulator [Pyrinomonadaceae bacterium]
MAAVLIVDDDATIREVLHELFDSEQTCHTAETAEQALSLLELNRYDVAIVDISLPGMSGLELLGHIRQRWTDTQVIIITGIDYHQYIDDLTKMGAFDYLVKPFQLQDAEKKVARAILQQEGWLDALKESAERALKHAQPSEVSDFGVIERRRAVRYNVERAARLLFTTAPSDVSADQRAQPTPSIVGHTRDISATGLSLIVPGVHENDLKFFGQRGTVRIILSLPTTMIDIELEPIRYEWLFAQGEKRGYVVGASITNISDGDREQLSDYLGVVRNPR